jgi:hypothetical protein
MKYLTSVVLIRHRKDNFFSSRFGSWRWRDSYWLMFVKLEVISLAWDFLTAFVGREFSSLLVVPFQRRRRENWNVQIVAVSMSSKNCWRKGASCSLLHYEEIYLLLKSRSFCTGFNRWTGPTMESYTFIVRRGLKRAAKCCYFCYLRVCGGVYPPPGHDDAVQLAAPPFRSWASSILMPFS